MVYEKKEDKIIKNISTKDLMAELDLRERAKQKKGKPKLLDNVDTWPLRKMCVDCINDIHGKGYIDEDLKQYIFECALEAFYGKDILKWINKQIG